MSDQPSPKKKMGQPSKYRKTICEEIVAFMSTGRSISAFAAEKKLSRDILYRWAERYPEFGEAMGTAREALAMSIASGSAAAHKTYKNSNSGMVMFMMSRRFPDYYKRSEGSAEGDGNEQGKDDQFTEEQLQEEIDRLLAIRERIKSSKKTSAAGDRRGGKK